jgi:hypothetical protein
MRSRITLGAILGGHVTSVVSLRRIIPFIAARTIAPSVRIRAVVMGFNRARYEKKRVLI